MVVNSRGGSPSRGKAYDPQTITLEILLKLLQQRGWEETAKCFQQEVANPLLSSTSPCGTEKDLASSEERAATVVVDVVTPRLEENLRVHVASARESHNGQRQQLAILTEQAMKQGQKMSDVRNLVHRMREVAAMSIRPNAAELEAQTSRKDLEIRELETICSEHDKLYRTLKLEVSQFEKEISDIRRQLENREDEETKARIRLTKLEEELRKIGTVASNTVPVSTQARKIQALLNDWHDHGSHLRMLVQSLFNSIDINRDGRLEWNNGEIRTFVHEIFKRNGILWPHWQEPVFYDMYRRCDSDHSYSLDFKEAANFAKCCFESALALVLTGQSDNGHDLVAEYQHAPRESTPVAHQAMTYSSGVIIDFIDFSRIYAPVIHANQTHRTRMIRVIETGEHLKATMRTYRECDKDGNGRLTWNNGEVRDFISACFLAHGLSPPHEELMYQMFSKFDKDHNHYLDMRECLEMVDALFRSTFVVELPAPVVPIGSVTSLSRELSRESSVTSLKRESITSYNMAGSIVGTNEMQALPGSGQYPIATSQIRVSSPVAPVVQQSSSQTSLRTSSQATTGYPKVVQHLTGSTTAPLPRTNSGSLGPLPIGTLVRSPRSGLHSPTSSRPGTPLGTTTMTVPFESSTSGVGIATIVSPTAPAPGTRIVVPASQDRTLSPPMKHERLVSPRTIASLPSLLGQESITKSQPGSAVGSMLPPAPFAPTAPTSSAAGSMHVPIQTPMANVDRSLSSSLSATNLRSANVASKPVPMGTLDASLSSSLSSTALRSAKSSAPSPGQSTTSSSQMRPTGPARTSPAPGSVPVRATAPSVVQSSNILAGQYGAYRQPRALAPVLRSRR